MRNNEHFVFQESGPTRDHYAVLGLSISAKHEEIIKAYRALARKYHPDHNPGNKEAEERFKDIALAYAVLSDSQKRAEYDRSLIDPRTGATRQGIADEPEAYFESRPLRVKIKREREGWSVNGHLVSKEIMSVEEKDGLVIGKYEDGLVCLIHPNTAGILTGGFRKILVMQNKVTGIQQNFKQVLIEPNSGLVSKEYLEIFVKGDIAYGVTKKGTLGFGAKREQINL